jgi:hypothetical protein
MSMAKHLGENLQDFINDLKAGIKGETGLTASSFYTLLILYLSVIVFGVSGNSLVLVSLSFVLSLIIGDYLTFRIFLQLVIFI